MGSTINPFGKDIIKVETELCGQTFSLEVGRVGFRSDASVLVRYGDTVIMGTSMVSDGPSSMPFFPLTIDYEEKFYAAGKISGSRFIKREGRPSEDAILIGRLIDRPIRPLWPKGYRNEVQGIATMLSMDPGFRPDMVAMIAVSTALSLTGAPFDGPIAGLRVGMDENGKYKAFMSAEELAKSKLDLVVAGTENGVMMVEAGADEASEADVVGAIEFAFKAMQPAIKAQQELIKKLGVVKQDNYELVLPDETIQKQVDDWMEGKLGEGMRAPYPERNELVANLRKDFHAAFEVEIGEGYSEIRDEYDEAFTKALHNDVRDGIAKHSVRPDGRKLTEIRPLSSEVGFLPRAHGSSLFTRGVTQGLNITTLAPLSYAQLLDTMEHNDDKKRFMHHYNAPGYTVGEVKRLGPPGRREIGHSALAERALLPMLPPEEDFPYTIRSVTEIMSQNGSTSMAATCASTLSLMDAGVPLTRPVSGIAMGLMLDGDTPYILSDIADAEDFAGDMDFKVAGTEKGITALQMDMKVHGLPVETLQKALEQGKDGRAHILKHMLETMPEPRKEMSPYAPRIEKMLIKPEKIRDVIGKGGEMINKIIADTGAEIDINDDGLVTVAAVDGKSIKAALEMIEAIVAEPEVGKTYDGVVVKLMEFGAFVNIMPGRDGLVHISRMAEARVEKVEDIVKEGDKVRVKLMAIDDQGRLNLSMKDTE